MSQDIERSAEARREAVEAELAAMGEPPLAGEAELSGSDREGENAEGFVHELLALRDAAERAPALDPLARRRVWARVEAARPAAHHRERGGGDSSAAAAEARPRRGFRGALALGGVLAAAVALSVALRPRARPPADTEALARAAHQGLAALGVERGPGADARRARAIAERIEARLRNAKGRRG